MLRRRSLLALLLALPLAGCGFHLRTNNELPFKKLAVEGKDGPLMASLKRQLAALGTQVVPRAQAQAVFTLLQDSSTQTPMAYNADGTVAQYQLAIDLRYQLATPEGDLLVQPTSLRQTSFLSYSTSATLAKADEADLLYRGMRQDLLSRILFQLSVLHAPAATPSP